MGIASFHELPTGRARADILKALAHPVRVLLVDALRGGDRCVCELNVLAAIDQSNISRHLAVLKKAGVVVVGYVLNVFLWRKGNVGPSAPDLAAWRP